MGTMSLSWIWGVSTIEMWDSPIVTTPSPMVQRQSGHSETPDTVYE